MNKSTTTFRDSPKSLKSLKLIMLLFKYTNSVRKSKMATTCDICIENFNRSTRVAIECPRCSFVCCKTCVKTYITDSNHYLECMSCRASLERCELSRMMGSQFMKTVYRDVRQEILYEQERGFFPGTQSVIETELEVEKLRNEIKGLDKKYAEIKKQRMIPLVAFVSSNMVMKISDVLNEYHTLQAHIESVDDQLLEEKALLESTIASLEDGLIDFDPTKRRLKVYALHCTTTDCKGMLSNDSKTKHGHFECTLCFGITCTECNMALGGDSKDHVCNPDILESLKFVESTSKACPGCNTAIQKIDGCDVMFCTSCHITFSWRTRKILRGELHNPHRTEWLRQNHHREREVNDIQCGRELTHNISHDVIRTFDSHAIEYRRSQKTAHKKKHDYLVSEFILYQIIVEQVIPGLEARQFTHASNHTLRVKLLRGLINDQEFKKEIQRLDKMASKKREWLQIAMTFRDSFIDIIWECHAAGREKTYQQWLESIDQIKKLEEYVNACLLEVSIAYGIRTQTIHTIR